MKRENNLIERIAEPENLFLAFWKAQKGKAGKLEVHRFRQNLQEKISLIREGLLNGTASPGDYSYFTIKDPKERRICAASFPERVIHHAIMNICEPCFEKYLIFDTYACRKRKGSHKAVDRAQVFTRRNRYYLSLDISKYFDSIDHDILFDLLEKRFKDVRLLNLFRAIINSYETSPGKGIPIGNLTSQYFANHYLGLMDHFIKEELRVKSYVRYMDNFVIWDNDRKELKNILSIMKTYLKDTLALDLNSSQCLNYCSKGVSFLGYRVFPNDLRLTQRSKQRFKRKLKKYENEYVTGKWSITDLQRHVQPLVAFTQHASADGFRRNVIERYGVVS